jgi:crotonobetaine/carnitine-CoA ligase
VSKGCVLSHEHLVWWGEEYCRAADLGPADLGYSPGPFFHINAWWALNGSIVNGTPHAFDIRFSGSNFWRQAEAANATLFDYVGVITTILLRRSEMPSPKSRIRAAMGGGARAQEVKEFKERFGIQLLECYGLTECCLPIFQREGEFRLGSIGKLSEYFEARLVGPDGADAPPEGRGELWLKPLSRRVIFSGYWRRDDLTAAAFQDGWFRTGDICRKDSDGYYYYLDRQRAFIRRRGENISPFELEGIVLDHPAVENCAVIGVPADLGEEDLLLAVQSKPGAVIDPAALLHWCSERMGRFMVPRYVRVMRLPLTPSERVERQTLRDEAVPDGTFDAEASGLFAGRANGPAPAAG